MGKELARVHECKSLHFVGGDMHEQDGAAHLTIPHAEHREAKGIYCRVLCWTLVARRVACVPPWVAK